ncbi:MAG TPA: hypothetical protein VGO46_17465 [Gemmatimonadaceae bacterium]|nr:hypothetical protein [Gemmatimonadaceae bacterium]
MPVLRFSASTMSCGRNGCSLAFVAFAVVFVLFGITFCGFYSIQPLGALPNGMTALVWRADDEPFFNSADALCLKRLGGVSLICRMESLGQAPTSRILLRLPFMKWAYEASTGGRSFDR